MKPNTTRNPLLLPLTAVSALLTIALGIGGFLLYHKGHPEVPPTLSAATPTPIPPTPTPKPRISDDTRTRVLNLIEKASKLSTLIDQGVAYTPFTDQLAEVKSAWETLNLVTWPQTWNREKANVESAIEGWSFAKEIWERKRKTDLEPFAKLQFLTGSQKIYESRLKQYSDTVVQRTEDHSSEMKFKILKEAFSPDFAIEWCLSAATLSFAKAREGIKIKLSE